MLSFNFIHFISSALLIPMCVCVYIYACIDMHIYLSIYIFLGKVILVVLLKKLLESI